MPAFPYLDGYLAAAAPWYVPRFANPWSIFLTDQRKSWDRGWLDAVLDRHPLPPRCLEPECSLPRRLHQH